MQIQWLFNLPINASLIANYLLSCSDKVIDKLEAFHAEPFSDLASFRLWPVTYVSRVHFVVLNSARDANNANQGPVF